MSKDSDATELLRSLPPMPRRKNTRIRLKPDSPEQNTKKERKRKPRQFQVDKKGNILPSEVFEEKQATQPTPTVDDRNLLAEPKPPAPKKEEALFRPFPGSQTFFLESSEYEVLLAGTRGGGKSLVLLFDALYDVEHPKFRGLIIRRTYSDLVELINRAKDYYLQVYPTAKWIASTYTFKFPSGATIEFGHLDHIDHLEKYKGQQYSWLGIDELTQIPEQLWYEKLKGSVRSTSPGLKPRIRATTNPDGPGKAWVHKYFITASESNVPLYSYFDIPKIGKVRLSRKWIFSHHSENTYLYENDPMYIASLATLSDAQRAAWYEGSWDFVEGAAFPDFDSEIHVCEPFMIPPSWPKIRAADWGYSNPAVVTWGAIDKSTDTLYIYREFVANDCDKNRMDAIIFAREVLAREVGEGVRYGILDSATWARGGQSGPSPAEEMIKEGCRWVPTDKPRTARVHGKYLMHSLLRKKDNGKPGIVIFSNCGGLIEMLKNITTDPHNVEDIDTDSKHDHWWDSLRYLIMSRPKNKKDAAEMAAMLRNNEPIIVNPTFGY